jgi:PAS domain S-box-containing protein
MGVALIATDPDLNIVFWNQAAARMFGAAADRMIGAPIGSTIPWEHRRDAEEAVRRVMKSGETRQFEWDHRDAQGQRRELAVTVASIVSETGECHGVSLCIRDITNRITLQNELHESRKMASLGEMAGAVAHHFNNIIGGVMTSIDYANTCHDAAVDRRVVTQIGRALGRAMGLVKGLLAFAQGDRHNEDWADLTETINEVTDETERLVQGKYIDFVLDLPNLPVWPVNHMALLTILRHVLRNAIEAMPEGGILRLEVSIENSSAVIRIGDTGVGLSDEAQSRMFEPFWTTKGVLGSGSSQSAGLGLAIAHGLTHMIGGTISVESEPNRGTRFTITIPATNL